MTHDHFKQNFFRSLVMIVGHCATLLILSWPLYVPAQSTGPSIQVQKPPPLRKAPPGPLQACADPSAVILFTHTLSGGQINVNFAGQICNKGSVDYNAPPFPRIRAVYYMNTHYTSEALSQSEMPIFKIYEEVIPNLRPGQCVVIDKAYVLPGVAQMGVNTNIPDTLPVTKTFTLKIETDSGILAGSTAENCSQANDSSTSKELVYMELWRFRK